MKKSIVYSILIWQIIGFSAVFKPGNAESKNNSTPIERARSLINELREVGEIPGIAVAVGTASGIVWEEGFGFTDLENSVRATPQTKFRIGSLSKMITIASAMRLVEQGVLDLDVPIAKYVSSLPEQYGKLTVKQLAGHLAGVRHYKQEDFQFDLKHFDSVKDSVKIFTGDPLQHEPGTKYLYSTFGYVLLSSVLEAVSGKEFLEIAEEEVFKPLKMTNSGADFVQEIILNKTRYYERSGGKVRNARFEDPSYKWSAGGMISTAGDLVRFGTAHLHSGYLKQQTLDKMFQSQHTSDGAETGIGVGWRIGADWQNRKIYHHAGNISGGRAVLILYPEQNLAIALLTNASGIPAFVESTAQLIAENFIQDGKTKFDSIAEDLSQKYEISGVNQDKPYKAKLELKRNAGNYTGSITGDFPLIDAAAKNGLPVRLNVATVLSKGNNMALVLVSPFGVVEMVIEKTDAGYRYTLEEGPAKFEGEMRSN